MMTKKAFILLALVFFTGGCSMFTDSDVKVTNLRCEYNVDPLGVDIASPRFFWRLESDQRGQKQTAYQILVSSSLENLKKGDAHLWDSGKVASGNSIQIEYGGKQLKPRQRCYWKSRVWDKDGKVSAWSEPAMWGMGLFEESDWQANWISPPLDKLKSVISSVEPSPYLRKSFSVDGKCKKATVYVVGLGLYRMYLNGEWVGDHIIAPEWTVYRERIQYQSFDVTEMLNSGDNAVGAVLGSGWYGEGFWGMPDMEKRLMKGRPGFRMRLDLEFADGKTKTITTDGSWRCTTDGPIRIGNLYQGEIYDGRKAMPGWNDVGFDDSQWSAVEVVDFGDVNLVRQIDEPVRITEELTPIALTEPEPGVYIFDMGQNMVGWCRLKVKGEYGDKVVLRHGEWVNDSGKLFTANLTSAKQTDTFYLNGQGQETLEPHFTYHGFRYVEVTGLKAKPELSDLEGCVFHNDLTVTGRFECSSELVNKLTTNILWTQRGNMIGIPTDCPQRAERCGWLGDMQTFSQTAIFNMDMSSFLSKWVFDMRDTRTPEGAFTEMAPKGQGPGVNQYSGAPGWGDAGVIVPWRIYQNYGDKRILEENYEAACGWIKFIHDRNPNLIWEADRGGDWADWVNGDMMNLEGWPKTGGAIPKTVFSTAFFAHSTEIVSKMAEVLDKEEDENYYSQLFEQIKGAFNKKFVKLDGRIEGDTQGGYGLALDFNLLPDELREKATRYILQAIERYNGHLSSGLHSTHRTMLELTRNNQHNEACRLINLRTVPSWGYMIDNNATTIWERWDGFVKSRGETFEDHVKVGYPAEMCSYNHYGYGAVGEWVWRAIAGINPDDANPGFKHFFIAPSPGPGFTWAKGIYDSIYGRIVSDWRIDDGKFNLNITVPANTTATVSLPTADNSSVTENGVAADKAIGVRFISVENGKCVFAVESGNYNFVSKWND